MVEKNIRTISEELAQRISAALDIDIPKTDKEYCSYFDEYWADKNKTAKYYKERISRKGEFIGAEAIKRECLKCSKEFKTHSKFTRICDHCTVINGSICEEYAI